ncbi:hypothetical protein A0128_11315 [Leptospira tipperaryensis]|uniref:Uncharacterized protein n=1 Tax=Leptospira tipperaryensis TaxID=2564040 RepID=A0A1D7UXS7_9LEPT|nr:hypothetical protein [Leptospira tipperaryensis]AOP34386.1 hypothetical protein A0128_11315 [Leptospira tipperaryensis]
MYKTIEQLLPKFGWFVLTVLLVLTQNCIPKPNGSSLLDTSVLANFISVSQTPIDLKVKVSGLTGGTLILQDDANETLSITANGDTKFPSQKAKYSAYTVSIVNQPNASPGPAITCSITNPNGILEPFFAYVEVICAGKTFPVAVNVFGISSSVVGNLQVRNGGVDLLTITSDGTYNFAAGVPDQSAYSVQILGSPQDHVCQFETPATASGVIASSGVTINVNCLSVINALPADQTVLLTTDSITLTFSKNVTGCALNNVNTPAGNLKFVQPASNFTYPTSNTLRINSGGAWTPGFGQYVRLVGCIDPGTGKAYNNGTPLVFTYTIANEVKYVVPTGLGGGLCNTVSNACSSIRYAVSQCAAIPCFVLVSEGTYSISDNATQRIDLKDGVNLMGGFNTTFTQRNPTTHISIIQDTSPFGNCGAAEGGTCAPIFAGPPFTTLTSNLLISMFTIKTNPNNPWSTGIFLNGLNTGIYQVIVAGNVIQGSNTGTAYAAGTIRSGIAAYGITPTLNIAFNYIVGGSGNGASAGIYISNSVGAVYANWVNGGSHVGAGANDFSSAIFAKNLTTTQTLVISNNIVNSYQLIGASGVTGANTSGIRTLNVNATNVHILHNSIYAGVGTVDSLGINSLGVGAEHKIANNQIFANTSATNSICMNFSPAPGATLEAKGNNLFNCTTLAKTPLFNFDLGCLGNPGPLKNNLLCLTSLATGANLQNFNFDPLFLPPANALTYFQLGSTSKCTSVFGGIDPSYPAYISLYQNDFSGIARTTNVSPPFPVPTGSYGYSIGAREFDGACQ